VAFLLNAEGLTLNAKTQNLYLYSAFGVLRSAFS